MIIKIESKIKIELERYQIRAGPKIFTEKGEKILNVFNGNTINQILWRNNAQKVILWPNTKIMGSYDSIMTVEMEINWLIAQMWAE